MHKRSPSINLALYTETVAILDPLLNAADRAVTFDGIKTLSGPEAQNYLKAIEALMVKLPTAAEQLRKRIYVSLRQGQHSLDMKRKKKAEREAAAEAATPKADAEPDAKTVARIRKLLALARDGGATEAEADGARAKADQMMAEFGLTEDDVQAFA